MEFLYNHKARITFLGHPTSVSLYRVSRPKRVVCRRIVRLSVLLQAESWLNVNTFCVTKVPFMAFFVIKAIWCCFFCGIISDFCLDICNNCFWHFE